MSVTSIYLTCMGHTGGSANYMFPSLAFHELWIARNHAAAVFPLLACQESLGQCCLKARNNSNTQISYNVL